MIGRPTATILLVCLTLTGAVFGAMGYRQYRQYRQGRGASG